jgi:hypothetical protein
LQEVERIGIWVGAADAAAGIAGAGVFDLDHVRAQPGQRLGAGRTRFELGEVEDLHAGKAILSAHVRALRFLAAAHYYCTAPPVETVATAVLRAGGRGGLRAMQHAQAAASRER